MKEDLFETLIAFVKAKTFDESQRIVQQHPELLRPETDSAMLQLAQAQENEKVKRMVEDHRALLARCREVGIRQAFAEKSGPSHEALLQIITTFINASSWNESEQIVEQHPELLRPKTDFMMQLIARTQQGEKAKRVVEEHRALLTRCREVGIHQAFAEKRVQGTQIVAPPNFEADIAEAQRLEGGRQRDPQTNQVLIQVYERILGRLQPGEHPAFRAAIQRKLGRAYRNLPVGDRGASLTRAIASYQDALRFFCAEATPSQYTAVQYELALTYTELPIGDRGANLKQAIKCFQESLRFWTPQATPSRYASMQNNLGSVYAQLPTGDRGENLTRAIEHYQEALRFQTPEVEPLDYAMTQSNLGAAYAALPTGNRAASLTQAIACFEEALRFRMLENVPHQYAGTQNNLGNAYTELPTGDRQANLAQAIECFEEALRFRRPETAPLDYAATQNNLGNAYLFMRTEDRGTNLAKAIACYSKALRFQTPETAPLEYAMIQNNLSYAYTELPTGDREANLKRAIRHSQKALRFYTPESAPYDYAMTQNNLGNAYLEMPTGDRAANLTQAIECYQETLRFWTPETAALNYATTQNNLGNAYLLMPTGEHYKRRAIQCFQEALCFRTLETTPLDYAMSQNSLGAAYFKLSTGKRGVNLAQAIACYQDALRVYTPIAAPLNYATTQSNLGAAYFELPTGNREANLAQAIQCFQESLRFRTPEGTPLEYATSQNNLGRAYFELPTGDREANLKRAIEYLQEARRFQTPESMPHDCRLTNLNLASLYFQEGDWHLALDAYRTAMDAGERLYRAGLSAESKATEVTENATLYRNAVFAAARLGDAAEALLILERGKTRILSEALRLRVSRPVAVPDEIWETFEQARAAVRTAQSASNTTMMTGQKRDPVQAYTNRVQTAQAASATLDAATHQVRKYAPNFLSEISLSTIQTLIPDNQTALVAFCLTEQGSYGFVLLRDQAVQLVDVPDFTRADLFRLLIEYDENSLPIGGWVVHYFNYQEERKEHQKKQTRITSERLQTAFYALQTTMTRVLSELGQRLLAPILATLPPDIERLTLLPSDRLFLLPLHAIPLSDDEIKRVCERYKVTYAPSTQVLTNILAKLAHREADGTAEKGRYDLYAVINPEEDPKLLFTSAEGAVLASLFAEHEIHERQAATLAAVTRGVRGRAYLHFSCHAAYNWHDPRASGLILSDGHLTLTDLSSGLADMSAARLATLSACETGLSDVFTGSAEEYVGLPAGFMLAGVPCVVSSLWPVRDISTALLMERFYHNHRKGGMDFVEALHEAQKWVRDLPIGEVAKYAEACDQQFKWGKKAKVELFKLMRNYQYRAQQNPNERPFAHPYYWAAFTVNGM